MAAKAAFFDDVGVLVGAVIFLAGGYFLHHSPKILNEQLRLLLIRKHLSLLINIIPKINAPPPKLLYPIHRNISLRIFVRAW